MSRPIPCPTLPVLALAMALGALAAPVRAAPDLLIDDFTTGRYRSPQVKSGEQRSQRQGARIVGGTRTVGLPQCAPDACAAQNPYHQGMSYAIFKSASADHPSAFIQNSPVFTGGRLEVDDGASPAVLDLDLSAYDRLRLHFGGLTEALNFNVPIYDDSGFNNVQGGCNAAPVNGGFSLELPFARMVARMVAPGGAIDWQHVTFIVLAFQPSSFIGGVEFALNRVSASASGTGGALACGF